MANTFGASDEKVKFMVDVLQPRGAGLDDVEIWIHTCWGNPNMQRVMEDTSYRASFELYLNEMRGDVWTIETKDRNFADIELFGRQGKAAEEDLHRCGAAIASLQADRAEDVAARFAPR
jgi:5-methyltetrahydropteroyltriglutamate--homocysteine methyltransferase